MGQTVVFTLIGGIYGVFFLTEMKLVAQYRFLYVHTTHRKVFFLEQDHVDIAFEHLSLLMWRTTFKDWVFWETTLIVKCLTLSQLHNRLTNHQAPRHLLHSFLFKNTPAHLHHYKINQTQNQTFYQNLGEFYSESALITVADP